MVATTSPPLQGVPLKWTRSQAPEPDLTSTTIMPWRGSAQLTGAYIIARKLTCSKFSNTLSSATDVVSTLTNSQLTGSSSSQRRFGVTKMQSPTEPPPRSEVRDATTNGSGDYFIESIHEQRPTPLPVTPVGREPRGLFLVGAGLGLLGGVIIDKFFGSDTANIQKISENLGKHLKLIKVTHQHLDILASNISRSNEIIKIN